MTPRYAESGSTWWPVLWAPAFCLAGAGVEALSGPVHVFAWVLIGVVLTLMVAAWVAARRNVYTVVLTDQALRQGGQSLPTSRIAAVLPEAPDGDVPRAPVLGGGLVVPRKTTEVPLELDDGTTALAWARDPARLRAALTALIGARREDQ